MGTTAALRTSYLLFPCENSVRIPFDLLVPLGGREVADLLERMALAEKLSERRHGSGELVYRDDLRIQQPPVRPSTEIRPTPGVSKPLAVAVHPSVTEEFLPAVPAGSHVGLHAEGGMVFLTGRYKGGLFESMEASWSEVMRCRLATARARPIPKLFQEFASGDPWSACEMLEVGIVLPGGRGPVRDIRPLLTASDLVPLLEWPEYDVRERAIAAMGRLQGCA